MSALFQRYGLEVEYAIVSKDDLHVLPIADTVLVTDVGVVTDDLPRTDGLSWSNELVAHVIEVRPALPVPELETLTEQFAQSVREINKRLDSHNAMLLPTGAHPFMNPATETVLWQHQWHEVYERYHKLFNCYRHGWANLQSTHLNFSFAGDEDFGKLHAALRLILPLIPALAASTPLLDGQLTGLMDSRLEVYRTNQAAYPLIAGRVIPEAIFTHAQYELELLKPMYASVDAIDPEKFLQTEALNSRGVRPVFSQGRAEVRLIDSQECPAADIAVAEFLNRIVKLLVSERWSSLSDQQTVTTESLAVILSATTKDAEQTAITDSVFLSQFGMSGTKTAGEVLQQLFKICWLSTEQSSTKDVLEQILNRGTLARAIVNRLPKSSSPGDIQHVYHELAACLQANVLLK